MGDALALAGQGAANQLFGALFFLMSFIATVTVPLVAKAYAAGDLQGARDRTCDSLFLGCAVSLVGMAVLVGAPQFALRLVLRPDAAAMPFAVEYLRLRSLSLVPGVFASVAFAALRGCLDVVTPLRVASVSNLINLVLDPILIFGGAAGAGLGLAGAAIATAVSEWCAGAIYLWLLVRRRLTSWRRLLRWPDHRSIRPLLRDASAMLFRTAMWNVVMLLRARAAQSMDPSGVSAAAYAITLQIYYVGIVFATAMQSTAAALVAAALARSPAEAQGVATRMLGWSFFVGLGVMTAQLLALPVLIPLFTTVPSVQAALVAPAVACSVLQLVNCVSYTTEGICMAYGKWGTLVKALAGAFSLFLVAVHSFGRFGWGLAGIWASLGVMNIATVGSLLGLLTRPHGPLGRARGRQAAAALPASGPSRRIWACKRSGRGGELADSRLVPAELEAAVDDFLRPVLDAGRQQPDDELANAILSGDSELLKALAEDGFLLPVPTTQQSMSQSMIAVPGASSLLGVRGGLPQRVESDAPVESGEQPVDTSGCS